jgi:hypothetical protein
MSIKYKHILIGKCILEYRVKTNVKSLLIKLELSDTETEARREYFNTIQSASVITKWNCLTRRLKQEESILRQYSLPQ